MQKESQCSKASVSLTAIKRTRANWRNDGRSFQTRIETVLLQYQSKGLLRCKKVDPPVKVLGFGKARRVIFLRNPFLDYVGTWTESGGRAVFFEAKSTSEPRLPFGGGAGVTADQLQVMKLWAQAGAAVFGLWEWRNNGVRFLTLHNFQAADSCGSKSIKWGSQESGALVSAGTGFVLFDFLDNMRFTFGNRASAP